MRSKDSETLAQAGALVCFKFTVYLPLFWKRTYVCDIFWMYVSTFSFLMLFWYEVLFYHYCLFDKSPLRFVKNTQINKVYILKHTFLSLMLPESSAEWMTYSIHIVIFTVFNVL